MSCQRGGLPNARNLLPPLLAAVDGAHQIIVAQTLPNSSSDQAQLAALLNQIRIDLQRNPGEVSAVAGCCSDANLRTVEQRRINGYIATGRQKRGTMPATATRPTKPGSAIARTTTKMKRAGLRSRYRLRKQIVEPVFVQINRQQASGNSCFVLSTR